MGRAPYKKVWLHRTTLWTWVRRQAFSACIVPTLSINVLDNKGHTTRYLLGTNDNRLEPGGRFAFSSRLIAPNAGVKSVSVTFEEQED